MYNNSSLKKNLEAIRKAILKLKPTGELGFEGFIGIILKEITGVPFRLAKSGSQRGIDGDASDSTDHISFECKLYNNKIDRDKILSKVAELGVRAEDSPDLLWILAATIPVASQDASDLRKIAEKNGISILILDWSNELPDIVTAIAMGGEKAELFLRKNIQDKAIVDNAIVALTFIRDLPEYTHNVERLKSLTDYPSFAIASAKKANQKWFDDIFSNKVIARNRTGQFLSPYDNSLEIKLLAREKEIKNLQPFFMEPQKSHVAIIHGNEGCGKSWIIAQTWSSLEIKPLMLFLTADQINENNTHDIESFLIDCLIKQIAEDIDRKDEHIKKWRRRLTVWKKQSSSDTMRLVVVIDGLNQKPSIEWGRLIDAFISTLSELGSNLLVTTRTGYYHNHIENRMVLEKKEIEIKQWTSKERDEILRSQGVDPSGLHNTVAVSLLNPRLLGIALNIFTKQQLTSFTELNTTRILFEYIRRMDQEPFNTQDTNDFKETLEENAREFIERITQDQKEDLKVFDISFASAITGNVFKTVYGEPNKYELTDDSLTLALGLYLIRQLLKAQRNNKNLDETISSMCEPIMALDRTSEIILAALIILSIESKEESSELIVALIKNFITLQNTDESKYLDSFYELANKHIQDFIQAAYDVSLLWKMLPNFDWLKAALMNASQNKKSWTVIEARINHWLSCYSESSEIWLSSWRYRSEEELQRERIVRQKEIENKLNSLTKVEKERLQTMFPIKGNINMLLRLAFSLLIGKPLVNFTDSLVNFYFGRAINSAFDAPIKEFNCLLTLNTIDWEDTYKAIQSVTQRILENDLSSTTKWALVNVWNAIGSNKDAEQANILKNELTRDRNLSSGNWKRIKSYCSTDPCDPKSVKPENIKSTLQNYIEQDVSKAYITMGQTSEDLYLDEARLGIARFYTKEAVKKHIELIENVLKRKGFPLRQGLLALHEHNVLITRQHAHTLIEKYCNINKTDDFQGISENDLWFVKNYHLLCAFPVLTAEEQIEALLNKEDESSIILDVLHIMKPLSKTLLNKWLGQIFNTENTYKQSLLLEVILATNTPLTIKAVDILSRLIITDNDKLRPLVLAIIAENKHPSLLKQLADSHWQATSDISDNKLENFYGSLALLAAANHGFISEQDALSRISPEFYGQASMLLKLETVKEIAKRLDSAIKLLTNYQTDKSIPKIELDLSHHAKYEPMPRFSFHLEESEQDKPINDAETFKKLRLDDSTNYELQQKYLRDSFYTFKDDLTHHKADILLQAFTLEEFTKIIQSEPSLADQWFNLFIELSGTRLRYCYNLIVLLAYTFSEQSPDKAKQLWEKIRDIIPLITISYEYAKINLEKMSAWAGTSSNVLEQYRFSRLDLAKDNDDLFYEVLAALFYKKEEILKKYIQQRLACEEPSYIARAIMIAGFMDENTLSDKILSDYKTQKGFIGEAYKAAQYAYERNQWARHWYKQMCSTNDKSEFWKCQMLFNKIVDGRYDIWHSEYKHIGSIMQLFHETIYSQIKSRINKWQNLRKKKLFGIDKPPSILIYEGLK